MKILLTGATGYIGKRLLPILVNEGHQVVCTVRDLQRFNPPPQLLSSIDCIEIDFLERESLDKIPKDIDAAYYLIHSMSTSSDYGDLERKSVENFAEALESTAAKHVIFLSGIVNDDNLSKHLASRKSVEDTLSNRSFHLTTFRAGIIIGSGSASFEIIRDLVEKLPVMIAPKWLNTKCQPIAIGDVLRILTRSLNKEECFDKNFDIGGSDILTYQDLLQLYAQNRGLKRLIITVPVMTPKLSSYWLYFITSTSYKLATALVDSMSVEVICRDSSINQLLDIQPLSYSEALTKTFDTIQQNDIVSSWKDSLVNGRFRNQLSDFLEVPVHGCFKDKRSMTLSNRSKTISRLWSIGGVNGWYYANILWKIRGQMDKLVGGVGLRRGRTNPDKLYAGDAVDFWRVLYANQQEGRLLLFAEMKLPGEAWLEFKVNEDRLDQTATFRPKGLWGRLYWYAVLPFHGIIFDGMAKQLSR